MFCIKTGMKNEYEVAKKYSQAAIVLTGIQTVEDLVRNAAGCDGIISFGMCGGLRPGLPIVSQTVIASVLIGPDGERYEVDKDWSKNLFSRTRDYMQPFYSSGRFNEASTPLQRAEIFAKTGAWCVDDESLFVMQYAKTRGIPAVIIRNVSDAWNDNVSLTSHILSRGGGADPIAVIKDLFKEPIEMAKIVYHYEQSQRQLYGLARTIAPTFCRYG
jgi:adenosylhomocysteine nucleosidase